MINVEMGKKEKAVHPHQVFFKVCRCNGVPLTKGVVLLSGCLEWCERRELLLYVSWFREVGNESNHHTYIHTSAYSDGESSKEQSPPGGDAGQWEVTFIHCLGSLQKKKNSIKKTESEISVCNDIKKKGNYFKNNVRKIKRKTNKIEDWTY